jgi:hypothetical protein
MGYQHPPRKGFRVISKEELKEVERLEAQTARMVRRAKKEGNNAANQAERNKETHR